MDECCNVYLHNKPKTRPRANDTRVRLIFYQLEKLQKISLLTYNMKSRACLLGMVPFVYKKKLSFIFKTITVLIVIRMKSHTQMLKILLNINSSACHSKSVKKYRLAIKNW